VNLNSGLQICGESNIKVFEEAAAAGVPRAVFVSVHDYGLPGLPLLCASPPIAHGLELHWPDSSSFVSGILLKSVYSILRSGVYLILGSGVWGLVLVPDIWGQVLVPDIGVWGLGFGVRCLYLILGSGVWGLGSGACT
jgi:hypothetical protein